MVDKFLWSVVLLLLYEAHARRNASQIPDDLHLNLFYLFLVFFFLFWGFDWKMQVKVYDTKYVTVCTSCLLSVCHSLTLASDWSRKCFTKTLTAEVTRGRWHALYNKKDVSFLNTSGILHRGIVSLQVRIIFYASSSLTVFSSFYHLVFFGNLNNDNCVFHIGYRQSGLKQT